MVLLDHTRLDTLSTLTGDVRSRKTPVPTWVLSSTFPEWEEVTIQPGNVFAGLMVVMDCHKIYSPDPAFH